MTDSDQSRVRQVWAIKAVVEASEEDARAAVEAIERALCPDPNHPGYCAVPWVVSSCALAEMDEVERASWQRDFDQDRAAYDRVLDERAGQPSPEPGSTDPLRVKGWE